ncbi:MAG: ubiquinone biosynthesis protein UbiB, partial [Candidatus Omnitrophica bacterium]|nr:ubiquinone biosynthesis protein UbiB [Candidatus Omnitrophota bacterium]
MLFRRARTHIRDLRRLQQVITILVRNGFGLFLSRLGMVHLRARAKKIEPSLLPKRIRVVLEELGPTFIKFG